jgi:hypothetical protein
MVEGDRGDGASGYFVVFCRATQIMFVYHRIGVAFVASQWIGDCDMPPSLGTCGPMLTSHGLLSVRVYQAHKVVSLSVDLPGGESSSGACTSTTWQENCLYTENKTGILSPTGVLCHGCEQQHEFRMCLGGKNECARIVFPEGMSPLPYDAVFARGHLEARKLGAQVDLLVHPRDYMPPLPQQTYLSRKSLRRGDVVEVLIPTTAAPPDDEGVGAPLSEAEELLHLLSSAAEDWVHAKVLKVLRLLSGEVEGYDVEHRSESGHYNSLVVPPSRVRCVGEWQQDVAPAGSNHRLLQRFYLDIGEEELARRCSTCAWDVLKEEFDAVADTFQGCVALDLHPGDPVVWLMDKFPGFHIIIGGAEVAAQAPEDQLASLPPPGIPKFCEYYAVKLAGEPRVGAPGAHTFDPPHQGCRYTRVSDYAHISDFTSFRFYAPPGGTNVAVGLPLFHAVGPDHFDASPMIEAREGDQLALRTADGKLLPTTLAELVSTDLTAIADVEGGQEVIVIRRAEVRTRLEVATAAGVCDTLWQRCCLMECCARNLFHMANAALSVKLVGYDGTWVCFVMVHRQGTVRKGTDAYGTDSTVMQVNPSSSAVMTTAYENDGSYDPDAYREWTCHWLRVYMQGVSDPTGGGFSFSDVQVEVLRAERTERDAQVAVVSQVGEDARGVQGPWVQLLHETPETVVEDLLRATGLVRFAGLASVPVGVQTVPTESGVMKQTDDQAAVMVLPPALIGDTARKASTILEYAAFWMSEGIKCAVEKELEAATKVRAQYMSNKLQVLCDVLCHNTAGMHHQQTVRRNFEDAGDHLIGSARGNFKSDADHRGFEEQYMPLVPAEELYIAPPRRPKRRRPPGG